MNRFFIGIFFLFALSAGAQSAPAGAAFTSGAQTVAVGAISEALTIQAQDAGGNAFKLPSTGCLALSSSASGEFSSSATSWSAVGVLTMNKNSANRSFYYKDTAAGTPTLTAWLVLKPESESRSCASWPVTEWPTGWTATQSIVVSSAASSTPQKNSENNSVAASSSPDTAATSVPSDNTYIASEPVPSLIVKISGPVAVVVGADAVFSATAFGIKKEPIPNARIIWAFGNGAIREGASVRHSYNIPGSYAVIANVSSGMLSGMARTTVKAIKPDIRITQVVPGAGGFVEIENRNNTELDVSGWGIASNNSVFTIPDNTVVLSASKVAFPVEVTRLPIIDARAQLLFPNGTLAAEYVVPQPVNIPRPPQADTPFKGGTPTSPLEGSAPSEARGRDVSTPTTTPAAVALSVSDNTTAPSVWKWLLGVVAVCLAGVGALAAFRFKPLPHKESDEKEFAKEIQIV